MKISVDCDDIIADHVGALIKFHNQRYGTFFSRDDVHTLRFYEVWGCTPQQAIDRIHEFCETPYFQELKPIEGSQTVLKRLAIDCEFYLVTARRDSLRTKTTQWINQNFPDIFSGIHFTRNHYSGWGAQTKAEVCSEIGAEIHIEDSADYASQFTNGTRVLLYDAPWNRNHSLPDNVQRVTSWNEIEKIILSHQVQGQASR